MVIEMMLINYQIALLEYFKINQLISEMKILSLLLLLILTYGQTCNQGCFQCDSNTKMCTACYQGFELTILGVCVKVNIPNCNLFMSATQCMRCLPTYQLVDNSCQRDYSGCIQNATTMKCNQCSSQLQLNSGNCVGVLNCKTFALQCLQCSQGFKLVKNICVASPTSCTSSNPYNGVCLQCQKGYDLIGYKCVSNMFYNPNCYLYNQGGTCLICKDGYSMAQGNCYGKTQVQNLKFTNTDVHQSNVISTSTTTIPAMVPVVIASTASNPASNNISSPKISQQNSAGGALTISESVKTSIGTAITTAPITTIASSNSPLLQTHSIPSVDPITQSKSTSPSTKSSSNLTVSQQLQTILSKTNVYCKNVNQGVCVECYQGYYLKQQICTQIDPLCKSFNLTQSQCQLCYPGYSLTLAKTCVVPPTIIRDPNCQTFQDKSCLQCYSNYHLKLGICIANNPLCKQHQPNGDCISCFNGYLLKGTDCIIDSSSTPNAFDPFCIQIKGYVCLLCANGYFVNNNGYCAPLSLNCLQHSLTDGSCIQCLNPYVMINKTCIQPVPNCLNYNNDGKCSLCPLGYFLRTGLCYLNDVTCAQYDQEGVCIQCIDTYYLVGGQCIFPSLGFDSLCSKYVNSYCTECDKGSFLSNYRCLEIDHNCINFDSSLVRCLGCANNMSARGIGCI